MINGECGWIAAYRSSYSRSRFNLVWRSVVISDYSVFIKELSQWLYHDGSTMNIVLNINIIIHY